MTERQERVEGLRGLVTSGPYGTGTKSQRRAVFLEAGEHRYVLRRKGGPVFADARLRRFIGHEVECDGFFVGTTLLAVRIEKVR